MENTLNVEAGVMVLIKNMSPEFVMEEIKSIFEDLI